MSETAVITQEPQRLRALERANEVRLARAELKRRIANGKVSAATIILESPWEAQSWAVGDLLLSQRRWGSTRCRKFLSRHQIMETKQVGKLTERQRRALAVELSERAHRDIRLIENGSAGNWHRPEAQPLGFDSSSELNPDRHRAGTGEQEEPDHEYR